MFYQPLAGWLAWIEDEDALVAWDGMAWVVAGGGGGGVSLNPATGGLVGINTTADATNKLAVKADAALFSHDDVTPGSGDHCVVVNKAAAGNTASFLFQTGFSGRAEIGTTGTDKFSFKTSPDGSTWYNALELDNFGRVGVGGSATGQALTVSEGSILTRANSAKGLWMEVYSDTPGHNPFQRQYRARGTLAVPAGVQNNDFLGALEWFGHDGGSFSACTRVVVRAKETHTPTAKGAYVQIFTVPAGSTTITQAMRIEASGDVLIGAVGVPSCKLQVDGAIRAASYTVATMPAVASVGVGAQVWCTDAVGGAGRPVLSNGTNWILADGTVIV